MTLIRVIFLLVIVALAVYAAVRMRRKSGAAEARDKRGNLRPGIGFTRLDGMQSLSLLLDNPSEMHVWVEEIEIFLSTLKAERQTAEASCHEILKIRQTVRRGDMLPVSLAEVIYKAAGDPQRRHSCVLSSLLRYRVGEEWFERKMDNFRIQMIGLKAADVHRERKPVAPLSTPPAPHAMPAMQIKAK